MNNQTLRNIQVGLIVFLLIILLLSLYWAIARPTFVKQSCDRVARQHAYERYDSLGEEKSISEYELTYTMCLREKGV